MSTAQQSINFNSERKKQIYRKISPAKEADVGPVMYARGMTRARATSAVVAEDPSKTIQHNAPPPSSSLRTALHLPPRLFSSPPPSPILHLSPLVPVELRIKPHRFSFPATITIKRALNLSLLSPAPSPSLVSGSSTSTTLTPPTYRAYS
jgi:hypothetical protein